MCYSSNCYTADNKNNFTLNINDLYEKYVLLQNDLKLSEEKQKNSQLSMNSDIKITIYSKTE